jgi:hypothetical protein
VVYSKVFIELNQQVSGFAHDWPEVCLQQYNKGFAPGHIENLQ